MSRSQQNAPEGEQSARSALPPDLDEVELLLMRYRAGTDLPPRADLVRQITQRISDEPPSSAPRRFLAAVAALDGPGVWRSFRQSLATAFGGQTRTVLLRAQAMAVVVVVIVSLSLGSVVGLAAASQVMKALREPSELRVTAPSPQRPPAVNAVSVTPVSESEAGVSPTQDLPTQASVPPPAEGSATAPDPKSKVKTPGVPNPKANPKANGKPPSPPKTNAKPPSPPKAQPPSPPKTNAKPPSPPKAKPPSPPKPKAKAPSTPKAPVQRRNAERR